MPAKGSKWSDQQRARHRATMDARMLARWGTTDRLVAKRAAHREHAAKTKATRARWRAEKLLGRDPQELRIARLEGQIGDLLHRIRRLEHALEHRRIADGGIQHTRKRRDVA